MCNRITLIFFTTIFAQTFQIYVPESETERVFAVYAISPTSKTKRLSDKPEVYHKCPPQATGQFAYDLSCNQFLNCWKGKGVVQNCAPGTLFNPLTLECDFPDKVQCVDDVQPSESRHARHLQQTSCPKDFTGLIPNYSDCSKCINCIRGSRHDVDCPPGTLFDVKRNVCDKPELVTCFQGAKRSGSYKSQDTTVNRIVKCANDQVGLYPHPDCSKFVQCANGQTFVQDCAPGTLFNPFLKICDFPYNVQCKGGAHNELDEITTTPDYDNQYQGQYGQSGSQRWEENHLGEGSGYKQQGGYYQTSYGHSGGNQGRENCPNGICKQQGGYQSSYGQNGAQNRPQYVRPNTGQSGTYGQSWNQNQYGSNCNQGNCKPTEQNVGQTDSSNCNQGNCNPKIPPGTSYGHVITWGNNRDCTQGNCVQNPSFPAGSPATTHQNQFRPSSGGQYYQGQTGNQYAGQNHQNVDSTNRKDCTQGSCGVNPSFPAGSRDTTQQNQFRPSSGNHGQTGMQYEGQNHQNVDSTRRNNCTHGNCASQNYPGNYVQNRTQFGRENWNQGNPQDPYSTNTNPCSGQANCQIPAQSNQGFYPNSGQPWRPNQYPDQDRIQHQNQGWKPNQYPQETSHRPTGSFPNYQGVVSLDEQLRTTPQPRRNPYEPFYGLPQSPDEYDDTYSPGRSAKPIEFTTPRSRQWPPPFPTENSEDLATAGSEYLAAENLHIDYGRTSCDMKRTFHCRNSAKCVSIAQQCDRIHDCPYGDDEMNCEEQVRKYKKHKNQRLAVEERERWDNVTVATCAMICLKSTKMDCRAFNYRKVDRTCFLMEENIGMSGRLIRYEPADFYELSNQRMDCSSMFVCPNGKCLNQSQVCDGQDDCLDRTDEKNCRPDKIGYRIRLLGSQKPNEGNIEITAFGTTGFICDDQFSLTDADVVCKELGFHLGAAQVKGNSYFEDQSQPTFLMDDVSCLGNETSLTECDFSGWGIHDCQGQEIAGVVCKTRQERCPKDYWQCDSKEECIPLAFVCDNSLDCSDDSDESAANCDAPTELRLVGPKRGEGRLEVRHNGIWGSICDDDFNEDAAKVVCRNLGFGNGAQVRKEAHFGQGTGPIWLDQVFCYGNETTLDECTHWGWGEHNCEHSEDVGVVCGKGEGIHHERHSTPSEILPEKCGYRNDQIFGKDDVHFRVVHASKANKGEYPWQAAIKIKGKNGKAGHWCGAVVISTRFVLTAAHCLVGYSKGSYIVVAGDYNVDEDEGSEQQAYIEEFYLHEGFREGHKMNNDIALIKLKGRGFDLGGEVQAICLPDTAADYSNLNCTISGFGSVKSGTAGFSHDLRAGWVPLQNREVCTMPHVYGEALTDGMFCAGELDEGVDACDGDSGGPLACLHDGVFTLYGITSWGQHCGYANKPGVYVKVAHYKQWIEEKIRKYSKE